MPTIEVDYSGFEGIQKAVKIAPREAHAALANALNRTASKTLTYTHEAVTDEYAVKRKGVKETMRIKKANRHNLQAEVISEDRRLKVSHFPFSAKGKNRIANVEIRRGGKVQSKSNPPLFVGKANGSSGKREVFTRVLNPNRYKITYGFTISIPQMIENEEVWNNISFKSGYFLQERFEHEWEQKLRRLAGMTDKG